MYSPSVTVIGAGIIGVTSAYYLSQSGYQVTLVDEREGPALSTSFGNGAQLSYSYTDAMASIALFKKIPKILLGMDPAFKIRPPLSFEFLKWGFQFAYNAAPKNEYKNTEQLFILAQESRSEMSKLLKRHAFSFDHRHSGKLLMYTDPSALKIAARGVEIKEKWGGDLSLLSTEQCIELDASLAPQRARMAGGIYSPSDDAASCPKFATELLNHLLSTSTVHALFNCNVIGFNQEHNKITKVKTSQGDIKSDYVVLAAGPESKSLAELAGVHAPIYPIKGYSITVPAKAGAPDICITDIENKLVIGRIGDHIRVAGCADIVGYNADIDPSRIQHLVNVCKQHYSDMGDFDTILNTWAGFRPVTPSSVPMIKQAGPKNFYVNVGHGMLGWTLAMGSAARLAALMPHQPVN